MSSFLEKFRSLIKERNGDNSDLSVYTARNKGLDPPTPIDEPYVLFNPPMDEGFPIGNIPDLDLTTFFDDIDDDGNPIIQNLGSKKFDESQINTSGKKNSQLACSPSITTTIMQKRKENFINKLTSPKNHTTAPKKNETKCDGHGYPSITEAKVELLLGQDSQTRRKRKSNKMCYNKSDTQCSLQRFAKQRQKIDGNNDMKTKKDGEHEVHLRSNFPGPILHSRGISDDDAKMEEKLETSKRKLHEGYQAHDRDRRRTKYLEGYKCHLPKDNCSRRNSLPRSIKRRKYN